MRTRDKILLTTAGTLTAGLCSTPALAQKDIEPKLPNVLLLIDNSGSMEHLMEPTGKLPGDPSAPGTACDGSVNLAARNRWANLVTAMTGSIGDSDFSCRTVARSGAAFTGEYGSNPYDLNYYLPFHRIYSGSCAYGAGKLPTTPTWNWWQLPSDAGSGGMNYTYRDPTGAETGSCTFVQAADGLLDAFRGLVRFGMMTLDTLPSPGTGSTPTATPASATADISDGHRGMWSYFHNWVSGAGPTPTVTAASGVNTSRPGAGRPAGCATASYMEVGARNQAAPPWEGRLVPFGPWNADTHIPATNDQIQMELLTLRPYGATPIAGLLDDAREFLFNDATNDPTNHRFGPSDDAYWINGCRRTFIILLSDGAPNMDLRTPGGAISGCDTVGTPDGVCPYDQADAIANDLRTSPPAAQRVYSFVVGFTVSDFSRMSPVPTVPSGATRCEDLDIATDCSSPPAQLHACCNLQKIAHSGGTTRAYFADTQNKLKQTLAAILSQIVSGSTDRTWPVFAPAGNRAAQGTNFTANPSASYQFAASFTVNAPPISGTSSVDSVVPGLWKGRLLRSRTSCPISTNTPTPQPVSLTNGDDFTYNLDLSDSSHPRRLFTVVGADDVDHDHGHVGVTPTIYSERTIRPFIPADDGLGTYKPNSSAPSAPALDTTFVTDMGSYPGAFGIASTTAACGTAFGLAPGPSRAEDCTKNLVRWDVGLNNAGFPSSIPLHTRDWSHCLVSCASPVGCACSKMGAIYHSTPVVVGPPREFLRDETYVNYASGSFAAYGGSGNVSQQPTMLYTATLDGQLHAFKVQANDSADSNKTDQAVNNEVWSFLPPAVLKGLLPNYNTAGAKLLDGAPVVTDVPGTVYTSAQTPLLMRTATSAVQWHRVLVASGGAAGGFYYALDITDPTRPRFLWQLSTDNDGDHLFGATTPTPAVAIVNATVGGTTQQVPVAILAGGGHDTTINHCGNGLKSVAAADSSVLLNDTSNPHLLAGITAATPDLRCWNYHKNSNRSTGNALFVVRLDNGQLLASFLGEKYRGAPNDDWGANDDHANDHGNHHSGATTAHEAPFRAPLTGVPVAYPGQTGEVSDRVYVGDADGLLWRLDMSDPDIGNWNVKLAWDSYVKDSASSSGDIREGISIPPIISRDALGNPVILVATGNQDLFSQQPTTNHVWSLTENPLTKKVSPNWHIALPQSTARVTGPMALFNGTVYFATFLPQAAGANPCSDGHASVWGVDYLRRGSAATAPAGLTPDNGEWPMPMFPTTTTAMAYGLDAADRTIIMGISVGETPTCDSLVGVSDPYFGSHTALSGVSSSSYQVMWQTGAGVGLPTTNTAVKNDPNVSGVQYIQPPPPGQGTRIDSWASIVD